MKDKSCMVGVVVIVCLLLVSGNLPAGNVPRTDNLNSVLWQQTSAEYGAICLETYRAARRLLEKAIATRGWSAAVEQKGDCAELPPAIILDIDETVLSNAPFAAFLAKHGIPFSNHRWTQWINRAEAEPLPGVVHFLQSAQAKGVQVFYITNRDYHFEAATAKNLQRYGLPLSRKPDTLLMRNEKPGWGSDKSSRRKVVAKHYRILFLFGDDLNDFVAGTKTTPETRKNLASRYADYWGEKWFILPNPIYGSWERALYDFKNLPYPDKVADKIRHLQPFK